MERVNSEDSSLSGTELDEPCAAFKKQSNQTVRWRQDDRRLPPVLRSKLHPLL